MTDFQIHLVRHGESAANAGVVDPQVVGDHTVPLTARGREQARAVGARLGPALVGGGLLYTSPLLRARQTLDELLAGAQVTPDALRIYEDPRLREVDHGWGDPREQQARRKVHGWFYYRYEGGESPADCYDRTSNFLEGLMRQVERKHTSTAVVVTHGLTIRCFVMRFLHLTVEQFDGLANPGNGEVVTIAPLATAPDPVFSRGRWGVWGLRTGRSD
jgi:broad specificity phosphatase PhoE